MRSCKYDTFYLVFYNLYIGSISDNVEQVENIEKSYI
uniref:Uncharacterized protein n=1 Tax=viral metagenome TaxID=1070528 RepID=A0A6C0LM23_9ZZZZ